MADEAKHGSLICSTFMCAMQLGAAVAEEDQGPFLLTNADCKHYSFDAPNQFAGHTSQM